MHKGRALLAGADVQLFPGSWVGVVGPNGAGKTTLLKAIAGLITHSGTVTGADGGRPGPRQLALVPQNPILPSGMTVAEYVLMGRTAHLGWLAQESARDRDAVAATLDRLELNAFASRNIRSLSGGEMQRVVIARALVQQADVLLLDEPTSALDVGHQAAVLELVHELRRADGLSVLAVMHDLTNAARFADQILLMANGRIVAAGLPTEVLTAPLLSDTYATPLRVEQIDGELVVLPVRMP